ncbi:hypothetical protein BS78_05G269800 [Paspalum vaginatum]|uniref:Protein kinase domain-containing protein n=1 Tax=Paspalum vaginatum TaxID=158149 RepID=A0A9W7XAA8_9POAL|nr:hypothetical protein BS78_K235400 [Paspalum vaginatum]KAJ1277116.1 hypothetical protein BS78_05G269800 [Paspalum vaginatum]
MALLQVDVWRHLLVHALVVVISSSQLVTTTTADSSSSSPGNNCPDMCGDVEIPYPFGIGVGCGRPGFTPSNLICYNSSSPPKLYLGNTEVKSISPETGEARVFTFPSWLCYDTPSTFSTYEGSVNLSDPFLISATSNEFTAIGCNTLALLKGTSRYAGCVTYCISIQDAADDDDTCTGNGCCQIPISPNLSNLAVNWNGASNGTYENPAWSYSSCSYAFVAEKAWYNFKRQDLIREENNTFFERVRGTIPLVLDWAIRDDGACRPPPKDAGASAKPTAPACVSANSFCVNATQGDGYLCKCSDGYLGNPYVTGAKECSNINECNLRKSDLDKYEKVYPCYGGSTCLDTEGSYKCKCKFGQSGDGKIEGGCHPIFPLWTIPIFVIFVVAIITTFTALEVKRRNQRRFFDKNGGDILKSMGINIFTESQLKKITNGYKRSIGEGAFGKVYIGITDDKQQVAVKCCTAKGEVLPQEEFVNEITFQFRINHENLVRLVGCCLETDVPNLVFEFVPRGSLYNVLHGAGKLPLSLLVRLKIAVGSAEALAYMHSHGGHNHVHGDVKSGNILLDDNLTPKVSDFGSAKLVSVAGRYSKWCVSGDMSYIDPIYIKSGSFTEKSDVYSFGVVLLELVTRKPAKYGDNSLYIDFIKTYKEEGNGRKLYDQEILSSDDAQSHHHMECLDRICSLAVQSLKEDIDERPTMTDVVDELKRVKAIASGGSSSVAT